MAAVLVVLFMAQFISLVTSSQVPFQDRKLKEVAITGGRAGASSTLGLSCWSPINAFIAQHTCGWHNSHYSKGFPALIWYDFNRGVIPAEIAFQPRGDRDASGLTRTPTSYQFVGSTDFQCNVYSEWSVLCEDLSGRKTKNLYDTRYCAVKSQTAQAYKCLGIRILEDDDSDGYVSLSNIRIWERVSKGF